MVAGVILSRVDMLLLPSLTSLSITANLSAGLSMDRIDSKSWNDYITAFLAGLPANGLQKITIRVHIWPTDLHFLGAIQWARLDTALSGPGFSALKRMAVVVQTRTLEMDVQARVRSMIHSRAETLDERDIVRVEFHEPARGP